MEENNIPPAMPPEMPVTPPPSPLQVTSDNRPFADRPGIKILFIVLLSLALFIPQAFIYALISEREGRSTSAKFEIGASYGGMQSITGPVLTIPYCYPEAKADPIGVVTLLPAELNVEAGINTQTLSRGMYDAEVYDSDIRIAGQFTFDYLKGLPVPMSALRLDQAVVTIGVEGLKGIQSLSEFAFGGKEYELEGEGASAYGVIDTDWIGYGDDDVVVAVCDDNDGKRLAAVVDLTSVADSASIPYSFDMSLKGADMLMFTPVGKRNVIKMSGKSTDPSFSGMVLPVSREISGDSFSAEWLVSSINRGYPQAFMGSKPLYSYSESRVGTKFLTSSGNYQLSDRTLKYAILVIVLTFISVFFSEIVAHRPIHILQYLLIGLALVLFYVLMFSLSEHVSFGLAYILAAIMIITMIGLYILGALKSRKFAAIVSGVLTVIYLYVYVLLNLESYALLSGAIGLFIVLSVVMYISLKIKWK